MARRRKTPEGYVSGALRDLFAVERIYAIRVNSGVIVLKNEDGSKRAVKLATAGTADWLALVPIGEGPFIPVWCETKAGKNGLSLDQKEFRDEVTEQGHVYLMIRDVSELADWLRTFRASIR